jgi:putative endonuclease
MLKVALSVVSGSLEFTVYVLISESTGRRYVGQTDDLPRRLAEHNSVVHNPRKFTPRNAGPWRLLHQEPFPTRSAAMHREKWLKSGAGRATFYDAAQHQRDTFRSFLGFFGALKKGIGSSSGRPQGLGGRVPGRQPRSIGFCPLSPLTTRHSRQERSDRASSLTSVVKLIVNEG